MDDGRNTKEIPELIGEFTGLDNIVSHLRSFDTSDTGSVADVSPETLKGYVAFGALMCYTTSHGDDKRAVQELERAWETIAPTLGVAQPAEEPAQAG